MKLSVKYLVLAQILSFQAPYVLAGQWVGLGMTGGQKELLTQKTLMESEGSTISLLKDHTDKFENDNTFVQLYNSNFNSENIRVTNRDVFLALPSQLNYDQLMEALIKIRAARTLGANDISVRTEQMLKDTVISGPSGNELNLRELFAAAGANYTVEKKVKKKLKVRSPNRVTVTQQDFWIGGTHSSELLSQVSSLLGKEPLGFSELQANPGALAGRMIYWFTDTTKPVNENFFLALAQITWMRRQGAAIHLVSPYLPYARSDKPEFDVGTTTQGRLTADLIETVGTQGITVVRAHAPQSLGFFKIQAKEISGRSTIVSFLKSQKVECVISPDAGFQKDATKYQHELNAAYGGEKSVCLAVMNKERNSLGKETILGGTGLENIKDKQIVIVDDETSSGGTLSQVARVLQAYGPKSIFAVVTHLAGPAQKALDSETIQRLIVTNTVPVKITHPKLTVLSIASEIANEIKQEENNR